LTIYYDFQKGRGSAPILPALYSDMRGVFLKSYRIAAQAAHFFLEAKIPKQ
jgi:hypothetical protein